MGLERRGPVLISQDVNEIHEGISTTWAFADVDAEVPAGDYIYISNNNMVSIECEKCGSVCLPIGDAGSASDSRSYMRRCDSHIEIKHDVIVDHPSSDIRILCKDCVPDDYDKNNILSKPRFDPLPTTVFNSLGRVQRGVLWAVLELADSRDKLRMWEYGDLWIPRVDITSRVGASKPSISLAVHSLIDKGLLKGAYRAWVTYYGDSPPMHTASHEHGAGWIHQGKHPQDTFHNPDNRKPTLEKLALRNMGKYVAALHAVKGG